MTAHNIIVTFCIFSLLKYDMIFGKNLEHDTYGVKWSPWPVLCRGFVPDLALEIYVSFHVAQFFKLH